ncbi:MAG TPA: hypothetical protein VGR18_14960 [Rubrobacter sp.]|nr:hypothetical protein [Rubrobacter sp.]
MYPQTPNPTETSLGMFNEREDLLEQVARKSRLARWGRAIARAAVVFSLVVLAVLLFGPPSGMIGWVGAYLFPVVAVIGVMFGAFGLLMWGVLKLHGWGYKIY